MALLIVITVLAACSWSLFALARRLRRAQAGANYWLALLILLALGLAAGIAALSMPSINSVVARAS